MRKSDFKVLLVYPNLPLMLVPPLSVGIFTKLLKQEGYKTHLFDTTSYISEETVSPTNRVKFLQARQFDHQKDLGVSVKDNLLTNFRNYVIKLNPDVLLFSVVEDAYLKTLRMLESIHDLHIPHLLGGVFPTAAPHICMESPLINMIALGEGERTIVDFVESIRTNKPINQIPGTWYKDDNDEIHKNGQNGLVDINYSVPDFSLFENERFYRPMGGRIFKTIPIESYRGCPYLCTFCNSPMQVSFAKQTEQGNFLRRKSMEVLREEIKHLVDLYHPEFLYFIDDSFLARPPKEIDEFCKMYSEFKLPFWFNTRPENCGKKILETLRSIGCYRVSFGIECGNEQFRKKILKRYVSNEKLIGHFNIIAESGLAFSANLIIGFPGETRDLVMDTVDFVRNIYGYDTLTLSMFTPYHGTELRAVAVQNGWLDPKSITVHTTSTSMLNMPPPYLGREELDGLMRVLPLYCYFDKSEWLKIRRAEIADDEGDRILKEYSDYYKLHFLKEKQDDPKDIFSVQSGTGCKSNSKDSYRFNIPRLTHSEIEVLTVCSV